MICPNCQKAIEETTEKCPHCGEALSPKKPRLKALNGILVGLAAVQLVAAGGIGAVLHQKRSEKALELEQQQALELAQMTETTMAAETTTTSETTTTATEAYAISVKVDNDAVMLTTEMTTATTAATSVTSTVWVKLAVPEEPNVAVYSSWNNKTPDEVDIKSTPDWISIRLTVAGRISNRSYDNLDVKNEQDRGDSNFVTIKVYKGNPAPEVIWDTNTELNYLDQAEKSNFENEIAAVLQHLLDDTDWLSGNYNSPFDYIDIGPDDGSWIYQGKNMTRVAMKTYYSTYLYQFLE